MQRVAGVIERGEWDPAKAADAVSLDASDRHRRRVVLKTGKGRELLLDLPQSVALRDGDGLVLEDRSIVRVIGIPEPVLDIEVDSATDLMRLAWHLGNRHTDVQILDNGLRILADHVLADMLRGLGARVTPHEATFEPESGAYAQHAVAHHHHSLEEHEHHHHHGDGEHGQGHRHDRDRHHAHSHSHQQGQKKS